MTNGLMMGQMNGAALSAAIETPRSSDLRRVTSVSQTEVISTLKVIQSMSRARRRVGMLDAMVARVVAMTVVARVLAYTRRRPEP